MKLKSLVGVVVAGAWAIACSSSTNSEEEFGTLSMNLRTVSALEQVYRLRDADFIVLDGAAEVGAVSSEDDPDSDRLTLQLSPGTYELGLLPGFRLEHIDADGDAEDVEFELLDERVREIDVVSDQTVTVSYRFQVLEVNEDEDGGEGEGDVAVIGGDVEVTIDVLEPEGAGGSAIATGGAGGAGGSAGSGLGGSGGNNFGVIDLPDDSSAEEAEEPPVVVLDVTFDVVQPIFAARCGPCHTSGGSGGHNVGAADLEQGYANSQLAAFSFTGTKGAATLARVEEGTMPPGVNCNETPEDAGCFTEDERLVIEAWIQDGQLPPAGL